MTTDDPRSDRVFQVYDTVVSFTDVYGYPPSIPDIMERTGIVAASLVNWYLELLEVGGYIERDRRISRGIRVLKPL